jgi:hypothetical protein
MAAAAGLNDITCLEPLLVYWDGRQRQKRAQTMPDSSFGTFRYASFLLFAFSNTN